MVCMGNICRSPTAEGVFRAKVAQAGLSERVKMDSAGTHNYHPGSPPDERSQAHALARGYDLSLLRARQVLDADYAHFDLILAMD
jgi:protein-tyrosine phosphatase